MLVSQLVDVRKVKQAIFFMQNTDHYGVPAASVSG